MGEKRSIHQAHTDWHNRMAGDQAWEKHRFHVLALFRDITMFPVFLLGPSALNCSITQMRKFEKGSLWVPSWNKFTSDHFSKMKLIWIYWNCVYLKIWSLSSLYEQDIIGTEKILTKITRRSNNSYVHHYEK